MVAENLFSAVKQTWSISTFCDEAISHFSVCLSVIRGFLAFKDMQVSPAATNSSYNEYDAVSWNCLQWDQFPG